jgi:lipopolysaccharide/colanic/teichoic acid biosynthesis glycosyltransferase
VFRHASTTQPPAGFDPAHDTCRNDARRNEVRRKSTKPWGRKVVRVIRSDKTSVPVSGLPVGGHRYSVLGEPAFHRMIALERKRTERSGQPFVLVLLDAGNALPSETGGKALGKMLSALSLSTRETDVTGWYKEAEVVGVMFTDIGTGDRASMMGTMMARVSETLRLNMSLEKSQQVGISMHIFPEEWDQESTHGNPALYPDFAQRQQGQKLAHAIKRAMDIVGSAAALTLLSPIFLAVALLVKLSSKGPILFKQPRLGQFGKSFTFLKFRSMYVNNDRGLHQEFMRRVIKGDHDGRSHGGDGEVYKMTNDPRITRIGALLRRTSLDEIPQFINVLKGDMSLVGPRPPIAYECKEYDIWHRRRVLEIKPGITGLWQVRGRSRVRFDDMVRLDLQYVRTWSVWLDLQILAATPRALFGDDAF